MKRYLWLAIAWFASLPFAPCDAPAQESPPERAGEQSPDRPAISSQILVAKIRDGRFVDGTDAEKAGVGKLGLSQTQELLSAAAAEAIWKGRSSMLDLTKYSKDEHYVIGLKDRRGRIFHELITPAKIPDDTGNRLRQTLVRQEEVLRLLDESDKQAGDEKLKTLSRVVEMIGPGEFNAAYPESAAAITASDAPFLADVRSKLNATAAGQERTQLVNRLHFDLSLALRSVSAGEPLEKQIEVVDKFIQERNLAPEVKQIMTMRKYLIWSGKARYEEAIAALDEALKLAPASALAGRIPQFKAAVRTKMEEAKRKDNPSPEGRSDGSTNPGPGENPPVTKDQGGK